jgi:hypothetical protein
MSSLNMCIRTSCGVGGGISAKNRRNQGRNDQIVNFLYQSIKSPTHIVLITVVYKKRDLNNLTTP